MPSPFIIYFPAQTGGGLSSTEVIIVAVVVSVVAVLILVVVVGVIVVMKKSNAKVGVDVEDTTSTRAGTNSNQVCNHDDE